MYEKKAPVFHSPDLSKMQVVVIDNRTRIYVAIDADPEEAKLKYISRLEAKNATYARGRKPLATT